MPEPLKLIALIFIIIIFEDQQLIPDFAYFINSLTLRTFRIFPAIAARSLTDLED